MYRNALVSTLVCALLSVTPAFAQSRDVQGGILLAQAAQAPGQAPAASQPAPAGGSQGRTADQPQIAGREEANKPERQAECMWIGQRVVSLLWRDDVNTAREQMNFYERFKCPSEHVGIAFRCVIRQSERQPQQTDLNARIYGCWMAPEISEQGN